MSEQPKPPLQLHLEPETPLEVSDLTGALSALARQYRKYAVENGFAAKSSQARLMVTSVSPGSIDIGFIPEVFENSKELVGYGAAVVATSTLAFTKGKEVVDAATGFAGSIKELLEKFRKNPVEEELSSDPDGPTVQDCNDAIAITRPTAEHGGTQTINVFNGTVYQPILNISADEALNIKENASETKSYLQYPEREIRQRVPLQWDALPRGDARTDGTRSPDKGVIEEIDPDAKSVLFTDDFAHLKEEMIAGDDNFMTKVYFVDVEVSRIDGKVVSYRVVGYQGKDDLS